MGDGICNGDWYVTHWYNDDTFAVLQPRKVWECTNTATPAPTSGSSADDDNTGGELKTIVILTMISGMLFVAWVMFRSCNPLRTDWYRLVFVYTIATLAVPISIFMGPSEGGFNRVAGFGILIHNLGEWFIIDRVWYGAKYVSAMSAIMYVWIIMVFITFLPLAPLFLVLMIQGSLCDWTLVFSFFYLGKWMDKHDPAHRKFMGCYGKLGTAAACLHIISIQPLFFAFATTLPISAITVILLVPTFILYAWFSSADMNQMPVVITGSKFSNRYLSKERNVLLRSVVLELKHRPVGNSELDRDDNDDAKASTNEDGDEIVNDLQKVAGSAEEPALENQILERALFANANVGDDTGMSYGDLIQRGLTHIDKKTRRTMGWLIAAAFLTATANSLIVFFAPCYIDASKFVC